MMKTIGALLVTAFLMGCATSGPTISKAELGNLEINVVGDGGSSLANADLYLDGIFIGNVSPRMPVLHAKRGKHIIRVECAGHQPVERSITVLGEPNHQVLNIILEPQKGQHQAGGDVQ